MKELGDILAALPRLTGPAVLVSVVAVEGSTYRRPGARMLVSTELPGGRIGSISGGCLEDEACRRAMYLTDKGPTVVTYETGLDDGAGPGFTLGCGGRVTVLFERIGPGLQPRFLEFIQGHRSAGRASVVATVIGVEGEPGIGLGERPLLLAEGGECAAAADETMRSEAVSALESARSRVWTWERARGRAHMLIEVVPAPVHLLLFGTGHDAEPVARLASGLGWRLTVVEVKSAPSARARFDGLGDVVTLGEAERRLKLPQARRAAAIVMNHHYVRDSESLEVLLGSDVPYVGVLGPRHRTDSMLSDIAAGVASGGVVIASEKLARIHAPIGLDIGAEASEEVALAIIAEVQAFFTNRNGGPLRDRPGAIHPPSGAGPVGAPVIGAACATGSLP